MAENKGLLTETASIIYDLLGGDDDFDKEGGYYPCADLADEKAKEILAKIREVVEGAKIQEVKEIAQKEIDRQIDFGYEPSYEDMVIAGKEAQIQAILKAIDKEE